MVATAGIRDSSAGVTVVSESSPLIRMATLSATTVYNYPTREMKASNSYVTTVADSSNTVRASQLVFRAVVRGRISNRKVRAWTYSLDGHDFYVIRLGDTETLIYDLTTQQWSSWNSPDLPFWRANTGLNWLGVSGVSLSGSLETNVIVGDDNFGMLWGFNPTQGYDELPRDDQPDTGFDRKVVGGIPMRLRETQKVGAAYVTASVGKPQITGSGMTLRTSDDSGNTWTNHGTVTVTLGNYDQEFVWRSLGLVKAPGKIFEITDSGATVRIDGLDIR